MSTGTASDPRPGHLPRATVPAGTVKVDLPGLEVLRELGRGAATVVYRARLDGSDYALKIFNPDAVGDQDIEQVLVGFRREAALIATISHPGLPRIHDVGQAGGRPYLLMDVVEGEQLADALRRGPLPPFQAAAVALDLAEALTAVHRKGLVHRDIKPQNVIIDDVGRARLIDFGLAASQARGGAGTAGTLVYAAPEQSGVLKRPVDNRSDLYALGVVLYECLAGAPPFLADDVGELLRQHAVAPPPDPRSAVPAVPPALSAVVATLLAKDPDDRYQRCDDLVADLRQLIADPSAVFTPGRQRVGTGGVADEPLCGRDHELGQLVARWMQARDGHGGVCVIRGQAGSGKSRLAAEIADLARGQGAIVLSGRSTAAEAMPLAPLRSATEEAMRRLARRPEEEHARWLRLLRSAAGSAAPLLAAFGPGLAAVLDAQPTAGGERWEPFTVAVVDYLSELARSSGGLLLHLDDVQWVDDATRRVIVRLAGQLRDVPLLVVCTGRDDESASRAATEKFCAALGDGLDLRLSLGPLDERGIAELITAQLPGLGAGSSLPHLLAVGSNGNPFVATEYLRAIIDAGLLRPSWDGWVLDEEGLRVLDLPVDALGLVLARVDALSAGCRSMLRVAAVMGPKFRPELVADVCGTDLDQILAAIAEAAGHRLVESRDSGEIVFVHDRIREALLDGAAESELRGLHRRIADAMGEKGDERPRAVYGRAHHYLLGERAGAGPRVFGCCLAAGRLALADHAPGAAAHFLEHAEQTGEPLDSEFLHTFGLALHREGRYAEARDRLEQALAAQPSALGRAAILLELGRVHRSTWNATAALETVYRGLAELGAPVPKHRLALAVTTVGLLIAGVFVALTGIGRGTARGQHARRYELITALNAVAAYIGTETMRPWMLVTHTARLMYPLYRMGSGATFEDRQAGLGFTAAMCGLRRVADRYFRQAEASAQKASDSERLAISRWYVGAATYMTGRDDGARWGRALLEHGRWLESGWQDDAYASLAWEAAVAGRTREAALWHRRGVQRPSFAQDEISAMITIGSVISAAEGRSVEAGGALRRLRPVLATHRSAGLYINLLLAEVYACLEQEEFGEPFERAVRDFLRLGMAPRLVIRQHRLFWVHLALGRVAQCRLPSDDDRVRAARRAAAGTALRQLRAVANSELMRHAHRLAAAQLQLVDGRPARCLRMLAKLPPAQPDAPMIAYEVARTRARALKALGHDAEAGRQANYAHQVALDEGWPHRARWIRDEFDPLPGVLGGGSRMHGTPNDTGADHQRLQALAAVSRASMRVVDPEALARIALDETIRILAAERAFLFLVPNEDTAEEPGGSGASGGLGASGASGAAGEPGGGYVAGEPGGRGRLVPYLGRDAAGNDIAELRGYATTLVERVAAAGEPIVVTGAEEGAALGARSAVLHGLRSIMVAPMLLDGRVLGVVYLDSQVAKGIFTAGDSDILTAITDHITAALETARAAQLEVSVQKARQQRDLAEMLHDALTRMSASLDPQVVLDRLLEYAARIRPEQDACLLTRTPSAVAACLLPRGMAAPVMIKLADEPALARFLTTTGTGPGRDLPAGLATLLGPVTSWLALPLATRDTAVGALLLTAPTPDAYGDVETNVAAALVAQAMTAYENATLFAQVQALAIVDELTGLPNRRHFFEMAERELPTALRHGRPVVAVMVDIDHFKHINDTHGHPTGDDVIKVVAARIGAGIRAGDICGRYGGEEFAIVLPDTDIEAGSTMAERLRREIAATPIPTRSGRLRVTASIGVAALDPSDERVDHLIARADRALYQAKAGGRNRVEASAG